MAELIVEVIDGTLAARAGIDANRFAARRCYARNHYAFWRVGECYRHQPADLFCFADIGPLLATALHDHPRLREMNVQFPAQTVRATVIGAGGNIPFRSLAAQYGWRAYNCRCAICRWRSRLMKRIWSVPGNRRWIQLDLAPKLTRTCWRFPPRCLCYAAVLTVINALVDFVARFPNPHPRWWWPGRTFGKALGMLLRPQLQQLPLAVIDEVIVRAGDYIDIIRLFWRIGCAGDGEITRISFLRERLMKLKTTLFGNVYQFKDVKEVLASANELRSGDVLAGVAAASSQERVAAKQVLSEMTVADIRNNPVIAYEDDCDAADSGRR